MSQDIGLSAEESGAVRFGSSGKDIIDELCEASIFDEAAEYLSSSDLKLSNESKLRFYSLFKQITVGPCDGKNKPGLLEFVARAKWNAWNDLGKMSKDEAIVLYVKELEKVAPSWKEHSSQKKKEKAAAKKVVKDCCKNNTCKSTGCNAGVSSAEEAAQHVYMHGGHHDNDDDDEDEDDDVDWDTEEEQKKHAASTQGFNITPSTMAFDEDDLTDSERTICYYASIDHEHELKKFLDAGTSINWKDSDGRTPLHWAVDRCHTSLVDRLISVYSADVNAQDNDGSTPLHYAILCEYVDIILILLKHSQINLSLKNNDDDQTLLELLKDLNNDQVNQALAQVKSKSE